MTDYEQKQDKPKHPGGRPRSIPSVEIFDERAAAYFSKCERENKRPLLTGLCLAVGLVTRQSLDEYSKLPEFSDSVRRAKLHVEMAYEEALIGSGNSAGPIFALKNFKWKDKQDVDLTSNGLAVGQIPPSVNVNFVKKDLNNEDIDI